jgi:hypothetical protein
MNTEQQNKWVSVKERLPEDMSDVLVYKKYGEIRIGYYRYSDDNWIVFGSDEYENIDFWMILPQPPQTK